MPRFTGKLSVSPYPDGKTWYLNRRLVYGDIVVPRGFQTDFASVPQVFTNILPRWDSYGMPSIVHDWLYWTQRTTRLEADEVLLEAMIACEVSVWKRQSVYRAVRMFGQFAWDDNSRLAAAGYSRVKSAGQPLLGWSR